MRAVSLKSGEALRPATTLPEPVPGFGQVLVQVKACGICGSDLHFAKHGADMIELGAQMKGMPLDLAGGRGSTSTATCTWATSSPPRCSRSAPTRRPPRRARSSRPSRSC